MDVGGVRFMESFEVVGSLEVVDGRREGFCDEGGD